MLPDNPFLQLTMPRVGRALVRLQGMIWTKVADVPCQFAGAWPEVKGWEEARRLSYKPVTKPFCWGKLFDQGWFKLQVPRVKSASPLYLHWNDQGEGTAYVDGMPFYGFDVAHRYCPLPAKATTIYMESLCLQSAIWHAAATGLDPRGSKLSEASLVTRNDMAWEVWHDLVVLYELVLEEYKVNYPTNPSKLAGGMGVGYQPPAEIVTPLYRRLLRALENAVNAFDQNGLPAFRKSLKEIYRTFATAEPLKVVLTGHAHIDLVWLWPEKSGEYKARHTFSTMNRLMDLYPEFVFGYSQPASYAAVERSAPQLMKQVDKRIASGKWEALGATEVESDTLMACGEALARSFTLGQKAFRKLQGKPSRVLWIPDVFGYCGSLPQIMRQTGVDYFFTTKLTWSNINRFPYSSFIWRGIDGSEVLVHVTQENGYNQNVTPTEIRMGANAYRQCDVHEEYLSPTGYGDGGGGVTEEMCERARRLKALSGMPEVGWGRVDKFFDKLNEVREKLPAWQGELYLEYHRGVLTSHGDLKAHFRDTERALQTWEAARCATGGGEIDDQAWRRLVFAQFHDYIPGSSIWEVYEEGLADLAAVSKNAYETAAKDLAKNKEGAPALFNPLPVERVHLLADKAVLLAPLSGKPIADMPALAPVRGVEATTCKITSDSVKATFDARGRIASLTFGEHTIATNGTLADLVLYPDYPHNFDAWEIDRQTLSLGKSVETPATARVLREGGLRSGVEFKRKLGEKSKVVVRYRLDAFQPVLHIEFDIDWREEQTLLKTVFHTAYTGASARFGAPYGSVLRCQQAGQPRDEAQFEGAGSRWAIVGDDGDTEGLGVITEAKYGFSCRDGILGASLLRSPLVTGGDPGHIRLFPPTLRRGGKRELCSDQGRHVIRLALCFHSPQIRREFLAPSLADSVFTPPLPYVGASVSAGLYGVEGLESVVPCWAKPAADGKGWILRLHETMGRRGKVRLRVGAGRKVTRTDLSEGITDPRPVRDVAIKPYELVSLRIQ